MLARNQHRDKHVIVERVRRNVFKEEPDVFKGHGFDYNSQRNDISNEDLEPVD